MVEPACSAPGLGRPSGRQDFSVSKSTPKAQTLGKLLIFLVIKTQVYLFSVFQNTNLSDFLFVLFWILFICPEKNKLSGLKQSLGVLFLGSSWDQAGHIPLSDTVITQQIQVSAYCVAGWALEGFERGKD